MIQQAFGDQILSRTQVFQWHARFKACRTSADGDEHTERPTSCTTHRETHKLHNTQGDPQAAQFLKLYLLIHCVVCLAIGLQPL
jgi:hypothetical protein